MNIYRTNFVLKYHHGYSLDELENMIPFEREIYISLLSNQLQKEEEQRKQRASLK